MVRNFYFAHPTSMYDTPVERLISQRFAREFPDTRVENPNQPHHSEGYQREGMDYFVHLCEAQDGVFFATHSDGSVGAGVAKEIASFSERHAPIYAFDPAQERFVQVNDLSGFSVLDVDHTRQTLAHERELKAAGADPFQNLETFRQSTGHGFEAVA